MKEFLTAIGGVGIAILIVAGLSFVVSKAKGQDTMTNLYPGSVISDPNIRPLPQLTKLSAREWVDLSKVSYIQLPVYIPAPGCTDCASRWGARIIIDGSITEYSEEAEVELRKLLNVK